MTFELLFVRIVPEILPRFLFFSGAPDGLLIEIFDSETDDFIDA